MQNNAYLDLFLDWLNFQKNERLLRLKSANETASTIVANVIGDQGMGEGVCMSCLRRRTECNDNVLLFDSAGTIGIRGNNVFATDESRTSKVSGGIVNFKKILR